MYIFRYLSITLATLSMAFCMNSQNPDNPMLVGQCEGCEAVLEYRPEMLSETDTLPGFSQEGVKIKVEGTVYKPDGKSPAPGVVIYVYHTDQQGLYTPRKGAKGWALKHGYNRGWVKTDDQGRYAFYTLKPAPYPNRSEPAHIHYIVMEPNGRYYWLDSCVFQGDPLLSKKDKPHVVPRGGHSGLLQLRQEGHIMAGTRNIVLGANIPGYH